MKNIIKIISTLALIITITGCSTHNAPHHKSHDYYNYRTDYTNHDTKTCQQKKQNKKQQNKLHAKMYTRNNNGDASEIGYTKFYDIDQGVKMVVNVNRLRNDIDYTTKIYQCNDTKCTNPDTCCRETDMSLEMPLTRDNKKSQSLQETFIIKNVNTNQLQDAMIFFERDNGYRAAWGVIK